MYLLSRYMVRHFFNATCIATRSNNLIHTPIKMNSPNNFAKRRDAIVWIDLEMTGLDVNKDYILEIACVVTDSDLNIVAKGPNIVIHQPEEILNQMSPWCQSQHGESGLKQESLNSNTTVKEAEREILKFVSSHVQEKVCPLGGNSVYMDRLFISKYMPQLNSYLHHRIIDVSTVKEIAKRWYPQDFTKVPQKKFEHRCLSDILESIEELKFYKSHIFQEDE